MVMLLGCETTPEEDFIYSQETVDFLDKWEPAFLQVRTPKAIRLLLESFAWALYQGIDSGEL